MLPPLRGLERLQFNFIRSKERVESNEKWFSYRSKRGVAGGGVMGLTGLPGLIGLTGFTGLPGATGLPGFTGLPGLIGLTGLIGFAGLIGLPGCTGLPGWTGEPGLIGLAEGSGVREGITFGGAGGGLCACAQTAAIPKSATRVNRAKR
jgi:hypothetical protein